MEKFFNITTEETLKKLDTTKEGLSNEEASNRLSKNGLNKLKEVKKRGLFLKFIDQFKNVMLIILIISAILSAIVSIKTHEPFTDTIIILFVVFCSDPHISFLYPLYINTAPHPPGPGFPEHAPSV